HALRERARCRGGASVEHGLVEKIFERVTTIAAGETDIAEQVVVVLPEGGRLFGRDSVTARERDGASEEEFPSFHDTPVEQPACHAETLAIARSSAEVVTAQVTLNASCERRSYFCLMPWRRSRRYRYTRSMPAAAAACATLP